MHPRRTRRISTRAASTIPTRLLRATDSPDIAYNGPPDGWVMDLEGNWQGPWSMSSDPLGRSVSLLPAVTRATQLIADTLAGLPWRQLRGRETLDPPRWVADPQLLRPDGRAGQDRRWPGALNRIDFWSQVITSMLWHGSGFVWTSETGLDGPRPGYSFVKVINPTHVTFDRDEGAYRVGGELLDESLGGRLIHFRGLAPYDEAGFGTGVLQRHALDLGLAESVRDYGANTFRSGVPAGYLKVTSQNLEQPQADKLKAKWLEAHGDRRSIAVLNSTTEFVPISISPLDAQLVEQKRMSLLDIALAFGLDPTFLGAPTGDSSTYANVESRQLIFVTHTLQPWARRIEETLSAELPLGSFLEVDFKGLLRSDTNTRFAAYATGLDKGFLLIDEVRELERLPVLPESAPVPEPAPELAPPQLTAVEGVPA